MSRCPYCHRELPGFETLCQQCFEKGYDRITHPAPWWKGFRLTYRSLYVFCFALIYVFATIHVNRDNPLTMMTRAALALALAAPVIVVELARSDRSAPRPTWRVVYPFLIVFLYFFLRLWADSTYHRIEHPIYVSFVAATIAGLMASFGNYPIQNSEQKK